MKRILLLGLIGFILSGCGDDKVTKEYLVGDWDCSVEEYESKNIPKSKEYNDYTLKNSEQFKEFYKIVDGDLMAKIDNEEAAKADIDKVYKRPTIEGKQGDCDYTINRSLIKNSSNKFTWQMEVFFDCSEEIGGVTKLKRKLIRVCTRIE